jgi:hypothetical protein
MSRTVLNFLLDTSLLVAFCGLIWAVTVIRFVFPPGPEAREWSLWGLGFDHWMSVVFGLVAVMTLGVLLHVMLHWSWVCGVVATRLSGRKNARLDEGTQTIYGVGLLIVLLNIIGVAIAVAALSIRGPA